MKRKKMIAMILAGGQGSRLKQLTEDLAKPAVAFGGKYRIIWIPCCYFDLAKNTMCFIVQFIKSNPFFRIVFCFFVSFQD